MNGAERCMLPSDASRAANAECGGSMLTGGIRIGRIFGIDIYLDWSWLLIFMIVTWILAAGVLPSWHPDWSPALAWGVGLIAALLFFSSVLLHELSHSLVARARGLQVRRITLFLFGGVANIEREPPSAATEFLMAVVGPLTSIGLGVIFLTAGVLASPGPSFISDPMAAAASLDPVTTLLFWLGPINIILGFFNLIPGFPLDGGRILRSALWAITGNLRKATAWAARVGQAIGWLFIGGGIAMAFGARIPFFGTGLLAGLWLAFIGWFLTNAARFNYKQVVIHDLLDGVPVSRLMRPDVPAVPSNARVTDLVYNAIMNSEDKSFPVIEGERMIGLVSLEDVRKLPREQWDSTVVNQIMTPVDRLVTVTPEGGVSGGLDGRTRGDVPQLPVAQNGRIVGMLRQRDIAKWLKLQSEARAQLNAKPI